MTWLPITAVTPWSPDTLIAQGKSACYWPKSWTAAFCLAHGWTHYLVLQWPEPASK